jgi:hypothetical protein
MNKPLSLEMKLLSPYGPLENMEGGSFTRDYEGKL